MKLKYKQLNLFGEEEREEIVEEILKREDSVLAINVSGGKDSQAMLSYLCKRAARESWECQIFIIHADLGRIEWPQTQEFVEKLAHVSKIPLVVVRRGKGDMIDRWQERYQTLSDQGNTKPFWSSANARYCTSDLKIQPINKYLRQFKLVVSAMGIRADESRNRANKPILSVRKNITTSKLTELSPSSAWEQWKANPSGRLAFDWLPIHDWDIEQVWNQCGTSSKDWQKRRTLDDSEAVSGWPCHPAYVLGHGNERLSCAFCVLASVNDLTNAIAYNPETYNHLVQLEEQSGWSFQHHRSLQSLSPSQPSPVTDYAD
ncbi:phosphoadenosine phosphosulfate reductase family protein [Laspinema olomoucense]|uniref:phosphoadenosine phosphosulfate reductase family protein n=1 Tax=Laspinema olomoucense TaxID=3231600 RepID=UPI0021BA6A4E|nr:phosphoadenosine phosphosulfate reductase family protein [Laspinema sp. D3d]MCT7971182.1 phosphoadenosine phosphosulfate reductase family protein [Laspinema sp. D3d]